jgi:hypothetical protein
MSLSRLSDPDAPEFAIDTANLLLGMPNTGQLLSGCYWNGTYGIGTTNPVVNWDFVATFIGLYQKMGGVTSKGFPYIMGMCDFFSHWGSWQYVYPSTAIPHALAGGLVSILWTPTPYNDYVAGQGSFGGSTAWPIMGYGNSDGSSFNQGLAATSSAFTFTGNDFTIPASLDTSDPSFQPSGYLWVETTKGYAVVSYSSWDSTGFIGCNCSATGWSVKNKAAIVDCALMIPNTPQNDALNYSLTDLGGLLGLLNTYQIAPLLRILHEPENTPTTLFWYAQTPTDYYQSLWNYYFNYVTGNAAQIPTSGANGNFETSGQPTIPDNPDGSPPTAPVHNAIWTFSQTGEGGAYGTNYLCPAVGQVDCIGLDYYKTNLANFTNPNSSRVFADRR